MKLKIMIVVALLLVLPACTKNTVNNQETNSSRVFEYVNEYNTETLIENHYIVLEQVGDHWTGRYYGTTDEFDEAREGYFPGFFVLDMEQLVLDESFIKFDLVLNEDQSFESPLPLSVKSSDEAMSGEYPLWVNSHMTGDRSYEGKIENDKIILEFDEDNRVFLETKFNSGDN